MENEKPKQSTIIRRGTTAIIGGLVLLVGIIAIPYPGPGWLIVFAGLAILSREFPWAGRLLHYGRRKYNVWNEWIKNQNRFIQSITLIVTIAIVIVTIYLLNGYGILDNLLKLRLDWLHSPLPIFH